MNERMNDEQPSTRTCRINCTEAEVELLADSQNGYITIKDLP